MTSSELAALLEKHTPPDATVYLSNGSEAIGILDVWDKDIQGWPKGVYLCGYPDPPHGGGHVHVAPSYVRDEHFSTLREIPVEIIREYLGSEET